MIQKRIFGQMLLSAVFVVSLVVGISWADNVADMGGAIGEAQDLPIRTVVLYSHGVGYFERGGTVEGGQPVSLHFGREQMNDLLKSLVAVDFSGTPISDIVYDSTKTVEQLLADYPFNLRSNFGLPQLMSQSQGTMVELVLANTDVRQGRIIGVEQRNVVQGESEQTRYLITIMDASGIMESYDVDSVSRFRFLDERLQGEFQRYLEILTQRNRNDEKTVTIYPGGTGPRELLVGYVSEAPIWKATYRLILSDASADELHLQGWAIVDNVSEEDWENVNLSLVSGLPISFVQNLYDPLFRQRPVIALATGPAVLPSTPEAQQFGVQLRRRAGSAGEMEMDRVSSSPMAAPGYAYGMDEGGGAMNLQQSITADDMRQLQSEAATSDLGELFEYRIDHPVTIARNRSALLPIVASDVSGQVVALYNESVRSANPMAAVRMTNTTGLTLEGGALTVFREGSYVGEGLVETIKADEQRYITYAVDLGVRVESENDSRSQDVFRVLIERGVMRQFRYVLATKTYNITNVDDEAKTVVIEHPINSGWELMTQEGLIETTDSYYRFEVEVPAQSTVAFAVQQRRDHVETIALRNVTSDDVLLYFRQHHIDEAIRDQLLQITSIKADIAQVDRQIDELRDRRGDITDEQRRLIEIRGRLRDTREEVALAADYISRIGAMETELDEIDVQLEQLRAQLEGLQNTLDELLENLSYDLRL
ncbi:MAG: hypothetical protein JW936_04060 [Sedimentisphaerales bacterium]|nr:hypothetical protein [Sedimentisphaerales bacterium]